MSIEHPADNPTESLPSFDETTTVPLKHSDEVNSTKNWTGIQETYHAATGEVPVDQSDAVLTGRRTTEEELGERAKENSGHLPKVIAGFAATAILAGGAIFGYNKVTDDSTRGSAESPAPTPDNATTAVANPSEQAPSEAVDISDITGRPTPEQVDLALEGIPGDLSPLEAVQYYNSVMNIYSNSAEIDISTTPPTETATSKERGDELLRVIFGDYYASQDIENYNKSRLEFSSQFAAAEILRDEYSHTVKIIPDETTLQKIDDSTFTVDIDEIKEDSNSDPNTDGLDADYHGSITMTKDGNKWVVQSTENFGKIE